MNLFRISREPHIDKGGGKLRPSTNAARRCPIPTVRDHVAQEVLRRLLSPLFEPLFHDDSFGFRPGRSCHTALERVLEIWRSGRRHVLDADISGFFDVIPHQVVMRGLTNVVADGNILNLVERFLSAGVMEDGVVQSTTMGTGTARRVVRPVNRGNQPSRDNGEGVGRHSLTHCVSDFEFKETDGDA